MICKKNYGENANLTVILRMGMHLSDWVSMRTQSLPISRLHRSRRWISRKFAKFCNLTKYISNFYKYIFNFDKYMFLFGQKYFQFIKLYFAILYHSVSLGWKYNFFHRVCIFFAICRNTFCSLYKYILQFVQIHFAVCTNTFGNLCKFLRMYFLICPFILSVALVSISFKQICKKKM